MKCAVLEIPFKLPMRRCPENPGGNAARCADCVKERIGWRPGIQNVELTSEGESAMLRLSYDPRLLTLTQLEAELQRVEPCIHTNRTQTVLGIDGMASPTCERRIHSTLAGMTGVVAAASYTAGTIRLEYDPETWDLSEIIARIEKMGYHVRGQRSTEIGAELAEVAVVAPLPPAGGPLAWARDHVEVLLVALSGLLLLAGFLVHLFHGAKLPPVIVVRFPLLAAFLTLVLHASPWLRITLLAASAILSSTETFAAATEALRGLKLDVDVLMFAAAAGAAYLGQYEEAALLLFLFGAGSAGEHIALKRARSAISALSKIAPENALRLQADGSTETVPVGQIAVGDRVVVRPFDRVAVDGEIVEGSSALDQSAVTGESIPVEKVPGDSVFAGTMNNEGRLIVRTTRLAGESTLSRIIRLVEEAQTTKSPTQVFTAKVERWYVPAVFLATTLIVFIPTLVFHGAWDVWFYRAMAFLTAGSPCALAIGTPAAVLCGIARAARDGVLIKGGMHLENLGLVQAIAFDKTGTLTVGHLTVSDVIPLADSSEDEILSLAASVEAHSVHPLATAIVKEAKARGCTIREATDVGQHPGLGAFGRIDGRRIAAGKHELITGDSNGDSGLLARVDELAGKGWAIVLVGRDDRPIGLIGLSDQARTNAPEVLNHLRRLGIKRNVMLTGDHVLAARAIARQVGVDDVQAGLLPEQKLECLRELSRQYGHVAMVGDGVNDAPALAQAAVGIAMGAAGSDIAMETADVVLMASDLGKLPFAIALSRRSRALIVQNLVIAIGVIAIVGPLAAFGFANLTLAVILHEGSTVVVVCNSLRLLAFRNPVGSAA
ncbi:MAG: cation-translocating P-type ATPase [Tepidisphaeraceae bacterium]|jgi:Cd2+/Zn2+-exporting ATPase